MDAMHGLLTDLYELTMAAGYFETGLAARTATFELSIRRLPEHREFVIAAGLAQAIEYLEGLSFEAAEIDYLRSVPQLAGAPASFFESLASFRFEGDVRAVPEGTPLFAGEPVMTVRGRLWQAQIAETYLLAMISFQTLIATKAARMVEAAAGRGWSSSERGARIRPKRACWQAGPRMSAAASAPATWRPVSVTASRSTARPRIRGCWRSRTSWLRTARFRSYWGPKPSTSSTPTTRWRARGKRHRSAGRCGACGWTAATWRSWRARCGESSTPRTWATRRSWLPAT